MTNRPLIKLVVNSGGSKGVPLVYAPTDQNILNFMHFLENLYVGAFPWRVDALSYRQSWIRPWLRLTIGLILNLRQ